MKSLSTFRLITVLICLLAHEGSARAVFIDHGSFSTDTNTNLDWLDVTLTVNLSFNAVNNGAGGWTTTGWRYATGSEVSNLFGTYVGSGPEDWYGGNAYHNALSLVRQLGVGISFNNSEGLNQIHGPNYPTQISVDGRFYDGNQNGLIGLGELIARTTDYRGEPNSLSSRWVVYSDFYPEAGLFPTLPNGHGSFLVRDSVSAVPLNGSPWLTLILGLAGFIAMARHQRWFGSVPDSTS